MIFKDLNISLVSKLLTEQLEQVTCFECCKCYSAPVTAECGHTLCNGCWYGRRQCPVCALTVERKILKLNLPLQSLTNHVLALIQTFEKLFNIKLAELELETTNKELQDDSNKNVTDWLANSQNQFSAPISSFSTQDLNPHVEFLTSEAQIHTSNVKINHQAEAASVQLPQDDWDKIEVMEETEDCVVKNQQSVMEPMDVEQMVIETMDIREDEYTTENPRRSTRKKEINSSSKEQPDEVQNEKAASTKSSIALSKQANKSKQTWNHAKRMRQEFSRLNKENRNKLNVSIETFKKSDLTKSNTKMIDKKTLPTDIAKNITSYEFNEQTEKEKKLKTQNYVDPHPVISSNHNSNKNIATTIDCDSSNKTPLNIQNENNKSIDSGNECDKEEINSPKVKFFKKGALHVKQKKTHYISDDIDQSKRTDDIEITIKVGKTITNICIKQKQIDPQLRVCTDREIQTSLGPENLSINITATDNKEHDKFEITEIKKTHLKSMRQPKTVPSITNAVSQSNKDVMTKSDSTKKNTASADTRTAQFEITASSEKELPDIIESVEDENKQKTTQSKKGDETDHVQFQGSSQKEDIPQEIQGIDDLFDCEFSKSPSVQSLKASKNVPSTILVSTQKLKKYTQVDKRIRSLDHDEPPLKKKQKLNTENVTFRNRSKAASNNSECSNYDLVMEKVFANIDADIEIIQTDNSPPAKELSNKASSLTTKTHVDNLQSQKCNHNKHCDHHNQKDSENLFSNCENDVIILANKLNTHIKSTHNESLTPNLCREFASQEEENREKENMVIEFGTPCDHESDVSIVEETPQKNVSNPKVKQKSAISSHDDNDISEQSEVNNYNRKATIKSVVDLCNSDKKSYEKNEEKAVLDVTNVKKPIVTPLTITKFVEQIQHKSTPVARKSLNFNIKSAKEDTEQTLSKSSFTVAETTQEKEFMNEVFQEAASSPDYNTTAILRQKNCKTEFCVAGSCLMTQQVGKLKRLCKDKGWRFVDEYTNDVTHLVIGVDDENKSKRSIKYMRALAAGKWIVGYTWVEKCIQLGTIVPEEPFECLDSTGEPGPRRSRLAKRKLFAGIAFYCMPPFSMLEDHILKEILENSGGSVVSDAREVRVADARPALLLAEPENTQDPKYTYLAMDLSIVPVHSEWILNCLGCYSLLSIQELLLCPASVLPEAVSQWPPDIVTRIH